MIYNYNIQSHIIKFLVATFARQLLHLLPHAIGIVAAWNVPFTRLKRVWSNQQIIIQVVHMQLEAFYMQATELVGVHRRWWLSITAESGSGNNGEFSFCSLIRKCGARKIGRILWKQPVRGEVWRVAKREFNNESVMTCIRSYEKMWNSRRSFYPPRSERAFLIAP